MLDLDLARGPLLILIGSVCGYQCALEQRALFKMMVELLFSFGNHRR
jgi:hypothetical protein